MQYLPTLSIAAIVSALGLQIAATQLNTYNNNHGNAEAVLASSTATSAQLSSAVLESATPLNTVLNTAPLQHSKIPLTLIDVQQPIDRVAALISSNEGSPTTIAWNDNGKGVSVGMFQANQRVGELPNLLLQLSTDEKGRQAMRNAFGDRLVKQIEKDPTVVQRLNIKKNNWLGKGLKQLVCSESFQTLQVNVLRKKVVKAAQVAKKHGIYSNAGVALCADLTNQWGERGAKRFLKAAQKQTTEESKLKAIVEAVDNASRYGDRYKQDLDKAKANGLELSSEFGA